MKTPTLVRRATGTAVVAGALISLGGCGMIGASQPAAHPLIQKSLSLKASHSAQGMGMLTGLSHTVSLQHAGSYAVVAAGNAYTTVNRAQGLQARFDSAGVHIMSLHSMQSWGMQLLGYGRLGSVQRLAAAHPTLQQNEVSYRWGALTALYRNTTQGLEQVFTLAGRPSGRGHTVVLVLQLHGQVNPSLTADGRSLALQSGGRMLRYSGVRAMDAMGHLLSAHLALSGMALRLEVNDSQAVYPISIDPAVR